MDKAQVSIFKPFHVEHTLNVGLRQADCNLLSIQPNTFDSLRTQPSQQHDARLNIANIDRLTRRMNKSARN